MVRNAVLTIAAGVAVMTAGPATANDGGYRQFAQLGGQPYYEEPVRPQRRARTRIEVRPGYTDPVPAGTRRECAARLVQEFRPSGTVIVPREYCWWVR